MQAAGSGATLLPAVEGPDDNDGYSSPAFDLSSSSETEDLPPPSKRLRHGKTAKDKVRYINSNNDLDDDEALALELLGKG
jgi:hypothetical protein